MYAKRCTLPIRPTTSRLQPRRTQQKNTTLRHPFQDMEPLIESQECDHMVNNQLKQDRMNGIPPQYKNSFQSLNTLIDDNMASNYKQCKVSNAVNVILRKDTHKADLVNYLHGCCFWPVQSTFLKAVKNKHFTTWPGLTPELVSKHLTPSVHTAKGHLKQEKQNLQPTDYKNKLREIQTKLARLKAANPSVSCKDFIEQDMDKDFFPISEQPNQRTNCIFYTTIQSSPTGLGYLDTTGRFPYCSARHNEYIYIAYNYDANTISSKAIPNRKSDTLHSAWQELHQQFEKAGVAPNTYILDNEFSGDIRTAFDKGNIHYDIVPPHNHRANAAERAILTFKNHFIAGLSGLDPKFPIKQWDRLLEQATLTLNLLRSSRLNPRLSAQAFLFGPFDFASTPLAPPGTRVVAHIKPSQRKSWAPRGEDAWYIGPALDHHRCIRCFFPRNRSERVVDTVTFFPHSIPFPKIDTETFLRQAATDIVDLLKNPPNTSIPTLTAGNSTYNAIRKLADILHRSDLPIQQHEQSLPATQSLSQLNLKSTKQQTHVNSAPTPPRVEAPAAPPRVIPPAPHPRAPTSITVTKTTAPSLPSALVPSSAHPRRPSIFKASTKTVRYVPPITRSKTLLHHSRYPLRSATRGTNFRNIATQFLVAQHIVTQHLNHIFDKFGNRQSLEKLLKSNDKATWNKSLSNEIGRLTNGNIHGVKARQCMKFIYFHQVPRDSKVTYANFVCDYRPLKSEKWRVRLVVGGDKLDYLPDSGSPTTTLLETKLLVNSVISDCKKGARFACCDIKDFFLSSPMATPEYMRIHRKYIPNDIINKYNLHNMFHNDHIYCQINKGMYGLKQAAILAYNLLYTRLNDAGYKPVVGSAGMFRHVTRSTMFCLCVDDFGIKHYSKDDLNHLLQTLGKHYEYSIDYTGADFCGLHYDWDYQNGFADVSLPKHVQTTLQRLQHKPLKSPQYSPHHHIAVRYSKQQGRQYATAQDTSPLLSPKETKWVQSVIGSFLYYCRAIDCTISTTLNDLAQK